MAGSLPGNRWLRTPATRSGSTCQASAIPTPTTSTPPPERAGWTRFVIDALDAWVATRTSPTVLVPANARLHHRAAFCARLQDWEDQDMHLFHLPTYSPHLNKMETLWRKVKYEWLRPAAYAGFSALKTAVWHILDHVGQHYTIKVAP